MPTIAQRKLRNDAGAVLKRAEAGEVFTVTVDGRPVAQLGPLPAPAGPVTPGALLAALAATPADAGWAADAQAAREADRDTAVDPWS
jgi:prevent-host-death family protein